MKNREIYVKDPVQQELLNNGVAEVKDTATPEEVRTLRYELETFVCDGQYAKGLRHILDTYLNNLKNPEQPAIWVSGFFGSGKSHLVKMLRALWVDYEFPDGATARGITRLDPEVSDLLRELSTQGRRTGGLHAAAGKLGSGAGKSVRLALLGIIFKSVGLPEQYPLAQFVMWLRDNNCLDIVKNYVEEAGKTWEKEVPKLYVSPVIAQALVNCFPNFVAKESEVGTLLKNQFPRVTDVSDGEVEEAISNALTVAGKFPCTLIALDEVQQYIGDDSDKTYEIQEVTEACSKRFGGLMLFVATGQTAMSSTPQLRKLKDRFRIGIELSDQDVDTVIREIILRKKPEHIAEIESVLVNHSGEISRHLSGTRLEPCSDDQQDLVPDYPLLPVRRRFWEKVLRAVDQASTQGQLRNQLKIVFEAAKATSDLNLGNVVGGDFIFKELSTDLLVTGVLPREIHENISKHRDGTADGDLKARICELAFLIAKLDRNPGSDLGIRATADTLADLLVEDLTAGSGDLRKRIPILLQEMLNRGQVMQVGDEFRLQTRESSAWDSEYRKRRATLLNDPQRLADERTALIQQECSNRLKSTTKLVQGQSKEARKLVLHFGLEYPAADDRTVPIWIRDGWTEEANTFEADAQQAGTDSPTVFVFIPKRKADEFQKHLADLKAAEETLDLKGVPNTREGQEARSSMETRKNEAAAQLKTLLDEILVNEVRVLQGGGQEVHGSTINDMVQRAAEVSLTRLFPEFDKADNPKWDSVISRARKGDGAALQVLNYQGDSDQHPVCKQVLQFLRIGKKGSDVRKFFSGSPYGWTQDAIDGSLYILLLTEGLKASFNGQPVTAQQLERSKLGQTEFRVEAITITAPQKIAIRKLFQEVGIACKPNEELSSWISQYLQKVMEVARSAGGDAPLPDRPQPPYLTELTQYSGNEQLLAVYNYQQQLSEDVKQWQQCAHTIGEREPQWQTLQQLLNYASRLPEAETVQVQVQAIANQRLLLQNPNPVAPLSDQLTQLLRDALTQARTEYQQSYDTQLAELRETDSWQQLSPEQQNQILSGAGLTTVLSIEVGTTAHLLKSLGSRSLAAWRTERDALAQKFSQARLQAAKLLEPKATQLKLPSTTLQTEAEADKWLSQVRQTILESLKNGPVII